MTYLLGEAVRLSAGPITGDSGLVTPVTLDLTITLPDSTTTVYHIGSFTVDSVGMLHLDYLPPAVGDYEWRMVATVPNAAAEGTFTVATPFSNQGGTSTLSDLIDDIQAYLYGFGVERDKETSLTANVGLTDLTIQVADGAQVDRGVIEIDDELLAVASSDKASGTITIQPWGRGYLNSVPATHTAGSRVANNPRFPRSRIKVTINQIINDIYPQLFAVAVDESNTVQAARCTYPVPAAAQSVQSVRVQSLGPSKRWYPVTRWAFDYNADSTAFPTGKSIDLIEPMPPGRPIKIVYRARFGTLVNSTDTLGSVGLEEGYRDVITLGVESRLMPALDGPRLMLGTIESKAQGQYDQPGTATQVSRQLFLQFQQRLKDEQDRLIRQYPATIVRMS